MIICHGFFIGIFSCKNKGESRFFHYFMNKDLKAKFPTWVDNNVEGEFTVCLSDDLDSLLGATILRELKGYEIKHFYSFEDFYSIDNDKRKAIGVDVALMNGMVWDNHVTMLGKYDKVNNQSANVNAIMQISRDNYTKKYAGSTALTMWAYYGIPLPSTDEGKIMLLSIDSAFKGHYSGFKHVQNGWLEELGMQELIDIQNKYDVLDFVKVKRQYDSSKKIFLHNGKLTTQMNLEGISKLLEISILLPDDIFYHRKSLDSTRIDISKMKSANKDLIEDKYNREIFSLALTSKNTVSLTFK